MLYVQIRVLKSQASHFYVVQANTLSLFAGIAVKKSRLLSLKCMFSSSLPQLCKCKDNCILIDD